MRALFLIALSPVALASCGGEVEEGEVAVIATTPDPLLTRALNDPLMIDPDLVLRDEGNAALSIRYDHALPPPIATTEAAEAAREAATRELIESGELEDIPLVSSGVGGQALPLGMTAGEIISATGAPNRCTSRIAEGLVWAARMPDAARVMPHGMVMQAAGAEQDRCRIRIVRYLTPVEPEDALRYHFNRASQARMTAKRYAQPEDMLDAERGSEHLKVHARPGPGGMTAVDLVYWRR